VFFFEEFDVFICVLILFYDRYDSILHEKKKIEELLFNKASHKNKTVDFLFYTDPMAAPPGTPTMTKSRGHSLFDRQAQLHAHDTDNKQPNYQSTIVYEMPLPQVKPFNSDSTSPVIHRHPPYSPKVSQRRSPLTTENYPETIGSNVQLIGIHPRPESTYIKDWPLPPTFSINISEQFLETDFPLHENLAIQETILPFKSLMPSDSVCCAMIEQAFDYLQIHDDDGDEDVDIIHYKNSIHNEDNVDGDYNEEHSDGGDSVDTIDLDATTSTNHQNDSKFYYSHCHYQLICSPI
jgi:hypothetical protein